MAGPKRRSRPCRLPKPSISIRVSRMPDSPPAPRSFVEGIERQLERSSDRLLLLARFVLVVNQLSHHLSAAGEFLGGGVEVMGDTRAIGNLEVSKSIAAFSR